MAGHDDPSAARGRRAVVFAGGDPPPRSVVAVLVGRLPDGAVVIGADSGAEHARALGLTVDVAVGDFDSIDPSVLTAIEAGGAAILRHPPDKDATDLELALDTAMLLEIDTVTVVGGHGGRVDHFLANCLLLGSERYRALALDAFVGSAHVVVVRDRALIGGHRGDVLTLLAVGGEARGIRTQGLRFPLDDAILQPGSTLGVSNEMVAESATVSVNHGTVLAIRPHALEPDPAPSSPDDGEA